MVLQTEIMGHGEGSRERKEIPGHGEGSQERKEDFWINLLTGSGQKTHKIIVCCFVFHSPILLVRISLEITLLYNYYA